ncbi:MAG: iron-sulfur cluster assembly scaffold protein [Deltaproteobacteria bacterium]|nr:iron-sulfur cluster assembly scaffold protein [Deltaproteobacteria bacterium]
MYHDALVRLSREATGAGRLEAPGGTAVVDNPLCGDRVTVDVRLEGGKVAALAHEVRGCLLCQASAAILGRLGPGSTGEEIAAAREGLVAMLDGAPPPAGRFAELAVFEPVRSVKSRRRCAVLPFEALGEAIARAGR